MMKHNTTEETIAKLKNIGSYIGYPTVLVTNKRPHFGSWKFAKWCEICNIRLIHTPPYHPQSNGQVER